MLVHPMANKGLKSSPAFQEAAQIHMLHKASSDDSSLKKKKKKSFYFLDLEQSSANVLDN